MSTTLTWASSGDGTKTNTTNAALLDDIDTLIGTKSGDATFFWEKAGKSNSGTPRYLLLRRKDASNGRIAIIIWDSAPANNNVNILDGTPTSNAVQIVWFPAGTGTTLSNLTAASGTVCGNDTGVVKCVSGGTVASTYGAGVVPFYFDSAEAMYFCFSDPSAGPTFMSGAGDLIVDASDVAYGACFATGAVANFGSGLMTAAFVTTPPNAGGVTAVVRTNYGASNRVYYQPWTPGSSWANVAVSSTDLLTDTATNKAWFISVQLLGQTKGEGFVLKFRQLGYGPGTVGAYTVYNTTGPVVAARQICNTTVGSNGRPWLVNFKLV